ncbi:tyrosine-type recombinase/integrase [Halomarina rubra]|uniref:Tyrosine-type recombinase/integrase n=1 Tax=Halomarina rubra TaxID=2071873 RepID=A0ABD6AZE5_9EURY|nr:tyrosine-type recombinase/integrase [Halomarina rubra]
MPRDPSEDVATLRRKLEAGDRGGCEADREALLAFLDEMQLLRDTYGHYRQRKLLRHCIRMSEQADTDLADACVDRDAAEVVVRWIHREYDLDETPETNQGYRVALRMFGKRTVGNGEVPDALSWITTTLPRNYNPAPNPAEMLRWEADVLRLIDHARNPRDAAAIALQFDAGLRGGELETLTVGDITEGEHSLRVFVDGKTGQRSVDLIPSIPYVRRWLTEHPGRDDHDAPLWSKLTTPESMSYQSYLKMFKEPAKRAGLDKPVTPTAFRKSNASWLARQGANAALIEDRQGRTRGSQWVARYVARFGNEAEAQYAKIHGLEVETDEAEEIAPLTCPRCDKETPRERDECVWCGQALSPEAAAKASDQNDRLREMFRLANGDMDRFERLLELDELLDDQPQARAGLEYD